MSGAKDDNDAEREGTLGNDPLAGCEPVAPKLTRLNDAMKAGVKLMMAGKEANPLRLGFTDLDAGMLKYGSKQVTLLAADSGVGKSTLSTQGALHAASCKHGVVYVNLEMSDEMYGLRTGANRAGVPTNRAAAGELTYDDQKKMLDAFTELSAPSRRIVLGNMREHRTPKAIRELVGESKRQLEAEGAPLRLVVVDHVLQVMVNVKAGDKDGEGHARADALKEIAEDFDVHVLALLHVTRDASKTRKMPTKNDLASSAWFDRHADNIMIFHQPRRADYTFEKNMPATLAVQKARYGSTFAIELNYADGFFMPWGLAKKTEAA